MLTSICMDLFCPVYGVCFSCVEGMHPQLFRGEENQKLFTSSTSLLLLTVFCPLKFAVCPLSVFYYEWSELANCSLPFPLLYYPQISTLAHPYVVQISNTRADDYYHSSQSLVNYGRPVFCLCFLIPMTWMLSTKKQQDNAQTEFDTFGLYILCFYELHYSSISYIFLFYTYAGTFGLIIIKINK